MSAVLSNVSKFPPIVETLDDLVHQYVNATVAAPLDAPVGRL